MSEIKHTVEIIIIIAHVLIIIHEFDKVKVSINSLVSKAKSAISTAPKSRSFLRKNFIFFDIILISSLCFGLNLSASADYVAESVYFIIFTLLVLIVAILFVPEDMKNYRDDTNQSDPSPDRLH
jgi:hypothetical protein